MPGHTYRIRDIEEHLDPFVVQREPAGRVERSATSEPQTPRRLNLVDFYNPFSRRRHNTFIVTERTTRRRYRARDDGLSDITLIPAQEIPTSSSPPPPPIIRRRSVRRASPPAPSSGHRRHVHISQPSPPALRNTMSPKPGQKGFVPLPPKIPTPAEEEQSREHEHKNESGRSSRSARSGDIEIVEEGHARRRSPRPYHRSRPSDPYKEQEGLMESAVRTVSANEHFEVIQPNEPIRSRQRNNDVRRSKDYRDLKELAERNYRAAQEATQRCSTAEVRLQTVQQQLAALEVNESKLRRELEETRRELADCRLDRRFDGRERDLRERRDRLAQEEFEFENKPRETGELERPRASRKPVTVHNTRYVTNTPDELDDPALAYIAQAHADARAKGRARG